MGPNTLRGSNKLSGGQEAFLVKRQALYPQNKLPTFCTTCSSILVHIPTLLARRRGRGGGAFDGCGLCCRSNLATLVISAASSNDLVTVGRVGSGRSGDIVTQSQNTQCKAELSPVYHNIRGVFPLYITFSSIEQYIDTGCVLLCRSTL